MAPILVITSLVTGLADSFLYGIFFILFILSTYFLYLRQAKFAGLENRKRNKWLASCLIKPAISSNIFMFVCVTSVKFYALSIRCPFLQLFWQDWVIVFIRMCQAFLGRASPQSYYGTLASSTAMARGIFMGLSILTGEIMIVSPKKACRLRDSFDGLPALPYVDRLGT
jgi:hypothetical protein